MKKIANARDFISPPKPSGEVKTRIKYGRVKESDFVSVPIGSLCIKIRNIAFVFQKEFISCKTFIESAQSIGEVSPYESIVKRYPFLLNSRPFASIHFKLDYMTEKEFFVELVKLRLK